MSVDWNSPGDFSLQRLSDYIGESTDQISTLRREVEEIQIGFNSAYVEWKAQHDATLERLVEVVTGRLAEAGPDAPAKQGDMLCTRIEERAAEERVTIADRRQELRERLIPETQAEADQALQEGQWLGDELRELNPRLDQREEGLKAQRSALEGELTQLNEQIRHLSGCLSLVYNFPKISRLGRQRQEAIGQLKVIQQELNRVREEWQEAQAQTQTQQEVLQAQWRELTLRLAQLQGELDYLDEEDSREALALRRAARYVIDNLKEPIGSSAGDIKSQLDAMVELNIQTDDYQEALGSVGSFMSVLDGIVEGLRRLNESVQGLINEQRMHASYLPQLHIAVPREVLAFHQQWTDLTQRVQDDSRLCAQPTEFVAMVRPVMEQNLSEANIKAMFDGLAQALERATSQWRG